MFIDARQLSAGSVLHAHVCIVGSGPAGLALALSLRKHGRRIIVLESGGLSGSKAANDLASPGEVFEFGGLSELSVHREVGGNSNAWRVRTPAFRDGVRLLRFTEADFESRAALPDQKWPISRQELEPHYQAAAKFFGINSLQDAPEPWLERDLAPLPTDSTKVRTSMYHFAQGVRLARDHRREIEAADDIELVYNATAVSLETNESANHVSRVLALADRELSLFVEANHIVLAAGGLFNTQILLNTDDVQKDGLGNASGALGRYLNDHPIIDGGDFLPAPFVLTKSAPLYDIRAIGGDAVMGHLQLSDDVLRREKVLNLGSILLPRRRDYREAQAYSLRQRNGWNAFRALKDPAKRANAKPFKIASDIVLGADGVLKGSIDYVLHRDAKLNRGGWSYRRDMKPNEVFEVLHMAEQAPHFDNRVYLGKQLDALGQRRISIDWRWHKSDQEMTIRAQDIFAQQIVAAGAGAFIPNRPDGALQVLRPSAGHYNGTTRMHDDPKKGVVDRDCKVHGVDNLYIASCSTFPTGSFANPTLSIVAFAMRIAEHLNAVQF